MPDMTTDNQAVEALMSDAQVFASAWSLVGGRFDSGECLSEAEERKAELRAAIAAALAAERQAERERWESAIGAVMPADFKDWHQNAASERPRVATAVIQSLRERESLAWDQVAAGRERALTQAIQRLNANPYSLTKDECISEIRAMKAKEEGK